MKITRLETIHVKPRWLFLKIHTDEGIVGLGEPIVEGRTLTTETAVEEIGRYLIGQDPRRIEHHWQAIYRDAFYRGGPVLTSALSGVEQALWDITGKWLGVPVWQLLGGNTRDRMTILISHRFSTVRMADEIVVLENGRIVEQGTHDALMQGTGRYAHLFTLQARGYR